MEKNLVVFFHDQSTKEELVRSHKNFGISIVPAAEVSKTDSISDSSAPTTYKQTAPHLIFLRLQSFIYNNLFV